MTVLQVSRLCTELISKDLRIFLHNHLLVTFSPASLHQHSLCQGEVWGMGWKKPSSLLLLILLQEQQRWNSGFVAINGTQAKILKGRISPCQAVLCNVNAASLYTHPSEDRGLQVESQKNNAKGRKGKVVPKTSVLGEQDSPLQRPPSPPVSPTLSSNSIP